MSGTFFGFNTALKSLFAQQKAMNTTSHNIANASTPGYTRQQAVMAADFAFPVPSMNRPGGAGQVGTGVNVVEMRRIRDQFLDKQIRQELATLGFWEQMAETLKLAETTFIEPSDSGLSTLFNEFWVTWQELSKNAENVAIRTSLVETSVSLAEALNHAHDQLTTIVDDLKYVANIKADQVNTIAQQIDDLNKQIAAIQLAGDAPNDLKDKRDLLLDELAKLVDFEIEETTVLRPSGKYDSDGNPIYVNVPDGQIRVYIGNEPDPAKRNVNDYLVHVNGTYTMTITDGYDSIEDINGDLIFVDSNLNTDDPEKPYFVVGGEPVKGVKPVTENSTLIGIQVDISVKNVNQIGFDEDEPNIGSMFKWMQEIDLAVYPFEYNDLANGLAESITNSNGQISGILKAMEQVEEYIGDLNRLAESLANDINQWHEQGVGLDGSTGLKYFVIDDDAAASITVNQELVDNISKIAASAKYFGGKIVEEPEGSDVWLVVDPITGDKMYEIEEDLSNPGVWLVLPVTLPDPTNPIGKLTQDNDGNWVVIDLSTGKPVADHNGGIALKISQLRPDIDRQYDQLVSRIGVKTNEANRRTDGQDVLIGQLEGRKESMSGVSLDEEMAMMLQFQRIYQASATMITTLDEMVQTILAMKR